MAHRREGTGSNLLPAMDALNPQSCCRTTPKPHSGGSHPLPITLQHQHPRARGEGLPILVPGELGGWDGTGVAVERGGLAKDSLSVLCHLPILVFLPVEDLKSFFGACLLLEDGGHCGDRLWSAVGNRDIDPPVRPQHLELRRCCFPAGLNFFPAHPSLLPQETPEFPCPCRDTPCSGCWLSAQGSPWTCTMKSLSSSPTALVATQV